MWGANGKPRLENGLQIVASIHMYVCLRMLREGIYIYVLYIYISRVDKIGISWEYMGLDT